MSNFFKNYINKLTVFNFSNFYFQYQELKSENLPLTSTIYIQFSIKSLPQSEKSYQVVKSVK